MKKLVLLSGLTFFGIGAWRIGTQLSADAIGMALGVLFGVLAGLPVALLVLASNRRRDRHEEDFGFEEGYPGRQGRQRALPPGYGYPMPMQQPPVIVLAGGPNGMQQGNGNGYGYGSGYPQQRMLPAPHGIEQEMPQERRYRVVGETEEWVEEW